MRWRRLGAATLASISVALTAVAAQVSPPNADSPTPVIGIAKKERKAIQLPATTLDLYVGTYLYAGIQPFKVTRKGNGLQTQLPSQIALDIFPESDTAFFYKAADAQIDFVTDGGPATALVQHQNGFDAHMPRMDDASAAQLKANIESRIASNSPAPGSEIAARKMINALSAGTPLNYDDMEPFTASLVRERAPGMAPYMKSLGAVQSIEFQRVGDGGWDVYRVRYENGSLLWRIGLTPSGKIGYALFLRDA
jgi:hypothetical protein